MKCVKCGKKAEKENFCRKCYLEFNPVIKSFKDISITLCSCCKKHFYRNKWAAYDELDDLIKKITREKIILSNSTAVMRLTVSEDRYKRKVIEIAIGDESYELPVSIQQGICPVCQKEKSHYFEGILQLRNPVPEVIDFIHSEIERQRHKGIFISNEEEVDEGIDFLLTSRRFGINIGNKLIERFGGILKINERLFSQNRQTSKVLYRVNVFFKPPHFKAGDIVLYEDKPVKITSTGKMMAGLYLKDGKKILFEYKENLEILPKLSTMVTKIHPHIEVLHPETFQSVETANNAGQKTLKNGDEVIVVVFKNQVFIA